MSALYREILIGIALSIVITSWVLFQLASLLPRLYF